MIDQLRAAKRRGLFTFCACAFTHVVSLSLSRLKFLMLSRWRNLILPPPALLLRHISSASGEVAFRCPGTEAQQVMGNDQKTIICYHPPTKVPCQNTKPLRKRKIWEKTSLTDEEVTLVRKLRQEDGSIWSVATLSRLLKVSPAIISRVAPASEERQRELDEERQMLRNMRRHKRKLYLLQRQATRESRLKELLAANKFPSTTELSQ